MPGSRIANCRTHPRSGARRVPGVGRFRFGESQRRKNIDRKYDFLSSRLAQVFGMLLCEGRITEEEVRGLREEKVKAIRSCATVLAEPPRLRVLP